MDYKFSKKTSSRKRHILIAGRTLCKNEVMEAQGEATESKIYDKKVCKTCEDMFTGSHRHNFEQKAPSSVPLK